MSQATQKSSTPTTVFHLVYAILKSGERDLLFIRTGQFDVDTWVASRQAALRLLGVEQILVEDLEAA